MVSSTKIGKTCPSHGTVATPEWRLACRCLAHPWSLLAMFVLALNDHWWKGLGPAWLTGKISDVAGLFYFPFLVTIPCALLFRARPSSIRLPVGRFVFSSVAIWFAAAKTLPAVHAVTVRLAGALVGEVRVARDPTDCLAILAIIPAWRLYRRLANAPPRPIARTLQPAALATAALLTAATQQPFVPSVDQLIVRDGLLHAVIDGRDAYASTDGVTWRPSNLSEAEILGHESATELSSGGVTIRVEDRKVVSSDGDEWLVVWSIPESRQEFMMVAGAGWWRGTDIAALPNSPGTLVVAFGSEGIVVRDESGAWARRGVGYVQPTPQRASLATAAGLVLRGQWVFGAAATVIAWMLMSFLVWCRAPDDRVPSASPRPVGWAKAADSAAALLRSLAALRFAGWSIAAILPGLVLPGLIFFSFLDPIEVGWENDLLPIPLLVLVAVPLLALAAVPVAFRWRRLRGSDLSRTAGKSLYPALGAGLISTGMLVLWDLGLIGSLTVAVALAAFAVLAVVLGCWSR